MAAEHDTRPWGSFTVLEDHEGHKVKRLVVNPGKRLSYQRHQHRSEHWFIVAGQAVVTLEGEDLKLSAGQSVDIEAGAAHRVESVGDTDLVLIEVQHGTYFGEDDIERLEDDFGRIV